MGHPKGTPTEFGGCRYRSQFEASVARDLTDRGVVFEYEGERVFYSVPFTYITDFTIPEEESVTGEPIYVECKGWLRPEDKRKLLAIKGDNPGMDLRILLYRGQQVSGKLTKEAKWCNKQGFKWAHKTVPGAWLQGKGGADA